MSSRYRLGRLIGGLCLALLSFPAAGADAPIDLDGVREEHAMIPMRDGARLSAYLYFPPGEGPWPVLFEQRYADLRGTPTRQAFARIAKAGYVVCGVNFRGAGQ
ncbi:MAG: acylase, partial [Planctomycetaceae bacterium]